MNLQKQFLLPLLAAGLALAGCGGGGSATTPMAPASKAAIAQTIENGFTAREQSLGNVGGTAPAQAARLAEGGGEGEPPSTYFDSYFELWVKATPDGATYFLDEALTQGAGASVRTFTDTNEGGITEIVTSITGGPRAGWTSTLKYGVIEGTFKVLYSGNDPLTGPFSFEVLNSDGRVTFTTSRTDPDGQVRFYNVSYEPDGTQKVSYNNESLYTYELVYAADGSGTGSVTGNSPLLPATLSWDTNGDGTLTFADGSTLPFTGFNFEF